MKMTKLKALMLTAMIELICIVLCFTLTYFFSEMSWIQCLITSLVLSLVVGYSTYSRLARAFNLDINPWKD
jgi:hypothetical protein